MVDLQTTMELFQVDLHLIALALLLVATGMIVGPIIHNSILVAVIGSRHFCQRMERV